MTGRFVVVTGLPASGKSTIGRAVTAGLDLPLIDKDDILESLFEQRVPSDAAGRQRLSRVADALFQRRASGSVGAVLVSWWQHPRSPAVSGTPTDWLGSLPGARVELHCVCSPVVAADRFLARRRHPGHLDRLRTPARLVEQFSVEAPLGALGAGPLVEVDTNDSVDLDALLRRLERAFDTTPCMRTRRSGEGCRATTARRRVIASPGRAATPVAPAAGPASTDADVADR